MDRVGADFPRAVRELHEKLGANPIVIVLPYGAEDKFKGVIDLLERRYLTFSDDDQGTTVTAHDIPADAAAEVDAARETLVEKVAELDDALAEKYLGGEEITVDELRDVVNKDELTSIFVRDALTRYDEKEAKLGPDGLREVERRVMLSVIDQRWREHLSEMDYLREGINLRAMGQRDPLSEWQREGFDMFEAMLAGIDDDFVRYVGHLQVVAEAPQSATSVRNLLYSAAEDPVGGAEAIRAAAAGSPEAVAMAEYDEPANRPVTVEKTPGRNDPCPCGSGKKFKLCHGK